MDSAERDEADVPSPSDSSSHADDPSSSGGKAPDPNTSTRSSSSGGLADWTAALRDVAPYLDLGWRLAATVAGPPLLGHFLVDVWLGTTPWGILGGALFGLVGAVVLLRQLQDEFDR